MSRDFEPFYQLWTTSDRWKSSHHAWLHDEFEKLDGFQMEDCVETSDKTLNKVIRQLKDRDVPQIKKIAESIKESVSDFKQFVPMGMAVRTEGMKERHWEMISQKVGFEVKPYPGFTFQHCIDMELVKWSEDIVEIGERAGKEYNIECSLSRMKEDWT